MSQYKPSNYIRRIDNKDLLFALMVTPTVPDDNYDIAFERLLKLCGLSGFKSLLDKRTKENIFRENAEIKKLIKLFSGRCIKVYDFAIEPEDMPEKEALKVLSEMKTRIDAGQDIAEVYEMYRKKCDHLGNGGEVYISGATLKMFPPGRARYAPKVDPKTLLKLKLNESIILEETATEEDRKYSKENIFTETRDAWNLCVIIDEFPYLSGKSPPSRSDPTGRMGIKMRGSDPFSW